MDYVKPIDLAEVMINAGRSKLALSPVDLVIRGGLAGAILAAATSLAITGAVQTNQPLVGALIFPVGLILIVLLGLDLVTGSFGIVPLPWIESEPMPRRLVANWGWVFLGNLIGSVVYGALLAIALTNFGATAPAGVAAKIIAIAEAKTIGYEALGYAGMITVFVKAILCNWMVCLAVVAAMTTTSTIGKIACAYMPVFIFFAQGFEHSVVNMFIIPTGMMMGAKVSVARMVAVESDSGDARQSRSAASCSPASRFISRTSPPHRAGAARRRRRGSRPNERGRSQRHCRQRKPAISSPNRNAIWKASSPACRSPRRRRAWPARRRLVRRPREAEPVGPDAAALKAQNRVARGRRQTLRPGEVQARAASLRQPMSGSRTDGVRNEYPKPPDNFRWRFFGLFYVAPNQNSYMCRLRIPNGILNAGAIRRRRRSRRAIRRRLRACDHPRQSADPRDRGGQCRRGDRGHSGSRPVLARLRRRQYPQRHRHADRRHRSARADRHPPFRARMAFPHPQRSLALRPAAQIQCRLRRRRHDPGARGHQRYRLPGSAR